MKKLLLAVALVVLALEPAVAADLARKVPAYNPPPPPPAPSFTGCYINGGAGYGLWNIDHFAKENSGVTLTNEVTSGGRGWLGRVGGGCDYQFGFGSGFWSNWAVGAFADYDFMNLHRNFQETFDRGIGNEKEKSAWAVGGRFLRQPQRDFSH